MRRRIYDAPSRVNPGAEQEVNGLLELLMALFLGKPISDEVIRRPFARHFGITKAKISESRKSELTKQIYQEMKGKTTDFILDESSTPTKKIYKDPFDPDNKDKQITYQLDEKTGKWQIFTGKDANAIIPNEKYLVKIDDGKAVTYGAAPVAVIDSDATILADSMKEANKKVGGFLHMYKIPDDKINEFEAKIAKEFQGMTCAKARAQALARIAKQYEAYQILPEMGKKPSVDQSGNWVMEMQDGIAILQQKVDGQFRLVSEPGKGNYVAVITHANGESILGGEILSRKRDGATCYVRNSSSEAKGFVPVASSGFLASGEEPKSWVEKTALASATPPPLAISVPGFELRCKFHDDNCQDDESNSHKAMVYVYQKIGDGNFKRDKSNSLIIEHCDDGKFMFRSGTNGEEYVSATVKITIDGKEHEVSFDGKGKVTTPPELPTRQSNPEFMCIGGCCGHYAQKNQKLMEEGAVALSR